MKMKNKSTSMKAILVGDSGCGKTSLISSFLNRDSADVLLNTTYVPTIFDVYKTTATVHKATKCNFTIHDTAGLEVYDRLRPLSYPDTDIVLLCFSIADPDSLRNVIDKWLPEVRHNCPNRPYVLVGTKSDLRADDKTVRTLSRRAKQEPVSRQHGLKLAKKIKALKYIECSALEKETVNFVFEYAAKKILKRHSTGNLFGALNMGFKMLKRHIKSSIQFKQPSDELLLL